jgi:hypothetical protein
VAPIFDRTLEDVGNIVHLEHVNVSQPDQRLATLFYVIGLGLTRDPYLMVGLDNMWINIGRHQMHLPTGNPQRLRGRIGLVVPDLVALKHRLAAVAQLLSGTRFCFADYEQFVELTCPWGNQFRCHAPKPELGKMQLGMPYVEFSVPEGTAARIAAFYREIMNAAGTVTTQEGTVIASVCTGRDQHLLFREVSEPLPAYDGHHIQIYIANFSAPYRRLTERNLITRDTDPHEYRFRDIVDVAGNEVLFTIEHEVRSIKHPLFGRPLVNRNPAQNNRDYLPGGDSLQV